jgi:hypothetical protein
MGLDSEISNEGVLNMLGGIRPTANNVAYSTGSYNVECLIAEPTSSLRSARETIDVPVDGRSEEPLSDSCWHPSGPSSFSPPGPLPFMPRESHEIS